MQAETAIRQTLSLPDAWVRVDHVRRILGGVSTTFLPSILASILFCKVSRYSGRKNFLA